MSTTSDFFREQTEKSAIKSAIVTNFFGIYLKIVNAKFDKKSITLTFLRDRGGMTMERLLHLYIFWT